MKPFYAFARAVTGLVLRLGGMKIEGRENIPADKAILIVCNHVSFGDPPALANVFPYQLTFIAKEEFSQSRFTRLLFGALGAVFLNKSESDLAAMRVVMRALGEGRAVAIFPEGKRNFDQVMSEFKPGASYISQRSQVRVLPVAVLNTGDFWHIWKRNLLVKIGRPIDPPPGNKPDKQLLEDYTILYQDKVAELLAAGRAELAATGRRMGVYKK